MLADEADLAPILLFAHAHEHDAAVEITHWFGPGPGPSWFVSHLQSSWCCSVYSKANFRQPILAHASRQLLL